VKSGIKYYGKKSEGTSGEGKKRKEETRQIVAEEKRIMAEPRKKIWYDHVLAKSE